MKLHRTVALLGLVLLISLSACGGGGGSSAAGTAATGVAQVSVTDAPGDFDHVWITVKDVWFHTSVNADPASGNWLKFPLPAPMTLDLLNLSNGSMQSIWNSITLPAGTYQQIRLVLEPTYPTASNPAPTGHTYFNEVVASTTGTSPLYVPDAKHGVRLTGAFRITEGGTLKLAIDFDAGHDIVEFHEGKDYILKPRLACFDLDKAGAIIGSLESSASITASRFVIKAERLATPEEMIESGATTTFHVVRRWTVPRADGSFVLYPVSTRVTGTWDIVIRGLNTKTMIIKDVPVVKGATPDAGATDLGTIAATASAANDYAVAGAIQSPTGSWVQFYQTLPGAGEYPYEIRFRHFNPLWGGFRQNFMMNNDQLEVASFASGTPIAFSAATPIQGKGIYDAVAGAMLFERSAASIVTSTTTTVQFSTLSVQPPYQANSVTASIMMSSRGLMDNKMNSGLLFGVHGGMIVNAVRVDSQMAMGGTGILTDLPGGTSATPLSGAFYGIDAVGWSSMNAAYSAVALPQIVDLRKGSASASMDMLPLW